MTPYRNEHGLAERHFRQRLVNDDGPRVHLLEVGLQECIGTISVGLVRTEASAAIVVMGARINARMACFSELVASL
jgi:hypothetical protein